MSVKSNPDFEGKYRPEATDANLCLSSSVLIIRMKAELRRDVARPSCIVWARAPQFGQWIFIIQSLIC